MEKYDASNPKCQECPSKETCKVLTEKVARGEVDESKVHQMDDLHKLLDILGGRAKMGIIRDGVSSLIQNSIKLYVMNNDKP